MSVITLRPNNVYQYYVTVNDQPWFNLDNIKVDNGSHAYVNIEKAYNPEHSPQRTVKVYKIDAANFIHHLNPNSRINKVIVYWKDFIRNTIGSYNQARSDLPTVQGLKLQIQRFTGWKDVRRKMTELIYLNSLEFTPSSLTPFHLRQGLDLYIQYDPNTSTKNDGRIYLNQVYIKVDYTDPKYALSAVAPPCPVGKLTTYRLTLRNTNGVHQGEVIPISINIPFMTVTGQSGGCGTYNATTKKWNAVLRSDGTAFLNLTLQTSSAGNRTITASVDGFSTSLNTVVSVHAPEYQIGIQSPEMALIGEDIRVTVIVGVDTDFVSSTTVNIPTPNGLTFKSSSGDGSFNSSTGVWTAPFSSQAAVRSFVYTANALGVSTVSVSTQGINRTRDIVIVPSEVTEPFYVEKEFPSEILTYINNDGVNLFSCYSYVTDTVLTDLYIGDKNFTVSVVNGDNEYFTNKVDMLGIIHRIGCLFMYDSSQPIKLRVYGQWLEVTPGNAEHQIGGLQINNISVDNFLAGGL